MSAAASSSELCVSFFQQGAGRWAGALLLFALMTGCQPAAKTATLPPPPEVVVAYPTEREFTETEEFTGRLVATETVQLRARASGYLKKVHFKDGGMVQKNDVLLVIDPRPAQAEAERARAQVNEDIAKVALAESNLKRAEKLLPTKGVSEQEVETLRAEKDTAIAALAAARAAQTMSELTVGFTEVRAPVDGQMGRRLVDEGNLVKADDTLLATLVSLDPIYVYFDVDERTVLKLRRLGQGEMLKPQDEKPIQVKLSLADEEEFKLTGTLDFVDNQLDPNTGTLRLRAKVPNTSHVLAPGLFVRCQLPVSAPRKALFVTEAALGSDQGERFLYVLNDQDEVVNRRVKVGPMVGGERVIESNLAAGERVVVQGLQRVRPKMKVTPQTAQPPAAAVTANEK